MSERLEHASVGDLSRYLEGDLAPRRREHVRRHLGGCTGCREELTCLRDISTALSGLPAPRPPADLLERILEARAGGERVILPIGAPPTPDESRIPWSLVGLAAALLLAALAGVLLLPAGDTRAGQNELEVLGSATFGEPWTVEYRTVSELAAEERLRLRGFARRARTPPPHIDPGIPIGGTLERLSEGVFRTRIRLPMNVVYASVTVEGLQGRRIDTNQGRTWEFLRRTSDGRPSFDALMEALAVANARRHRDALDVARRTTRLYPDHPLGWRGRLLYEQSIVPRMLQDSLTSYHRRNLARLDVLYSGRRPLSGDIVAGLAHYARMLDAEEVRSRWAKRLQNEHPDHEAAVGARAVQAYLAREDSFQSSTRRLEEEWERYGPRYDVVAHLAFEMAMQAENTQLVERWADRYRSTRPDLTGDIAGRASIFPEIRPKMMEWLREHIRSLSRAEDHRRPPYRTRAEQREIDLRRRASALASLGRALLEEDRATAALDTLTLAAARGWDPDLFGRIAKLRLQAGDVTGAARLLALAAVDPLEGADTAKSLPGTLRPHLEDATWRSMLLTARTELRRRLLKESLRWPLTDPIRLMDEKGDSRDLRYLFEGRTTLVTFAPLHYGAVKRVADGYALLERHGVQVLAVEEEVESAGPDLPRPRLPFPVFHDDRADVADLADWRYPTFLVIDDRGRLRFRHEDAEVAMRQAIVLSSAPPPRERSTP